MRACDMVQAVADALNRRHSNKTGQLYYPPAAYVTAVLVPAGSPVEVDRERIEALGILQVVEVASVPIVPDGEGSAAAVGGTHATAAAGSNAGVHYDPDALVAAIREVVAQHAAGRMQQQQHPRQVAWREGGPGG